MIKHPSIAQFKNVIRNIRQRAQFVGLDDNGDPIMNRQAEMPVLRFHGTVKLHGTNSSIVFGKEITFQSRNREITPDNDNAGFASHMVSSVGHSDLTKLEEMLLDKDVIKEHNELVVYGEWCGGNIQKGVAIAELPKMFVMFGVKVVDNDEEYWLDKELWKNVELPEQQIFNINKFETFLIDIDFNNPALIQNTLGELTEQVEKECPVGKYFGVSGIGEGIVWKCLHYDYQGSDFWMKVKGEKHSVSKVKTLAPVDIEKLKTVSEFLDRVVTDNRLDQGIEYLAEMGKPVDQKSTGEFLSWVFKDIEKEESDTMEASGITRKDIGKPLGDKARRWFFNKLEEIECQT